MDQDDSKPVELTGAQRLRLARAELLTREQFVAAIEIARQVDESSPELIGALTQAMATNYLSFTTVATSK